MSTPLKYDPRDIVVIHDRKRRLTKRHLPSVASDPIQTDSYDLSKYSEPTLLRITDIYELSRVLKTLEHHPHRAVIRGQPIEPLGGEPRRRLLHDQVDARTGNVETKATYRAVKRRWMMIDGDKLPLPGGLSLEDDPEVCIGWYRNEIARYAPEFSDVTFHAHLSSSTGLALLRDEPERKISVHLWMFLDRPHSDEDIKAWLRGINDRWRADKGADKKQALVDLALANAVQLHFTANPVFLHCDDPLPQRSWLIKGASNELGLDLPKAPETTCKVTSPSGDYQSQSSQGWIDQIGDDKGGFHEPIRQTIWEAVREHGDDLDTDDLRSRIIEAALAADRGSRSQDYVRQELRNFDRYLEGARRRVVGSPKRAAKDLLRLPDQSVDDPSIAVRDPRRRQQMLEEADHRLAAEAEDAWKEITRYKDMSVEADQKKIRAHEVIEAQLAVEFGFDLLIGPDEKAHYYGDYRKVRCTRRGVATRAIKKQIASKFGVEKFPSEAPNFLFLVSPGLGKTRAWLNRLAGQNELAADWFGPNYDLIEQSHEDYLKLKPETPTAIEQGRSRRDPENSLAGVDVPEGIGGNISETRDRMCPRFSVAGAAADKGFLPQSAICKTCPLVRSCGYQKQKVALKVVRNGHGTVFLPHAYITLPRKIGAGDIAIIDENFVSGVFRESHWFPLQVVRDPSVYFKLLKDPVIVADCLEVGERIYTAIAERGGEFGSIFDQAGVADDDLKKIVASLVASEGTGADIHGRLRDAEILSRLKDADVAGRRELLMVFRALRGAIKHGKGQLRNFKSKEQDDGTLLIKMVMMDFPRIPISTAMVVLDATANPDLVEEVTGRKFTVIKIDMPEAARMVQVTSGGSKQAIYGRQSRIKREDATEEQIEREDKNRAAIYRAIQEFCGGKEVLVGATAEIRYEWEEAKPPNFKLAHYGALRGLNEFIGVSYLVIAGHQTVSCHELELRRHAIALVHGGEIIDIESYQTRHSDAGERRHDRYLNRPEYVNAPWHPDPLVEAMRFDACEGEILQLIGRLRSRRRGTISILNLSPIPLPGMKADRTVAFRAIKQGRLYDTGLEVYFARLKRRGGRFAIVPLGSPDMAKIAPDLFKDPKAAKDARRNNKITHSTMLDCLKVINGSYRTEGQRGKMSEFVIAPLPGTPVDDVTISRKLESIVGKCSEIRLSPDAEGDHDGIAA